MLAKQLFIVVISLLLTVPAFADDAATGQATGKRQHKPLPAAEQEQATEEAKGTRVRKGMQDLKNNAQDSTPTMNKAELTETLANDAGLSKADSKRAVEPGGTSERLRHKDRDVAEKTDKNEAARSKKKD